MNSIAGGIYVESSGAFVLMMDSTLIGNMGMGPAASFALMGTGSVVEMRGSDVRDLSTVVYKKHTQEQLKQHSAV